MVGFIVYSTLGSVLWTALLAFGGYILESQYEKGSDYLDPISRAVIALIIIVYVYRLVRLKLR